MKKILVYGTRNCDDCMRTKKWLKEHEIDFTEIFIEDDHAYVEKTLELTNGDTRTPVLLFPDGSYLVEPTNDELAKKFSNP